MLYCINIMSRIITKLTITVHRVHLTVKFPCSLSTQLKIQSQESPIGRQVPLRLGQALLQMTISRDLQVIYDPQRKLLEQKKISVLIFLKSGSGRIPAGAAFIHLNSLKKGNNLLKLHIEKCPDRQAFIQLTVFFEGPNELFSPNSYQEKEQQEQDISHRVNFDSHQMYGLTPQIQEEMNSHRNGNLSDAESPIKRSKQLQQPSFYSSRHKKYTSTVKNQDYVESQYQQNDMSHQFQQKGRKKISDFERELKNVQKKLDQYIIETKSEARKREITEKALKQSQVQLKIMKEKHEDMKIQYESFVKKSQYKANSLKEQLKYTSQKLSASQAQKQKLMFEKNELVNGLEERETYLRQGLRQKEKNNSEEKNRISKKLQEITNQYQSFKAAGNQIQLKVNELEAQLAAQQNINQKSIDQNNLLVKENIVLKQQLTQDRNKRLALQEALQSKDELEEEKKKSRIKVNQLQQEINKQLIKISQAQASSLKYLQKSEELQARLAQQLNLLKLSRNQNQSLLKESQALKEQLKENKKKGQQLQQTKSQQCQKLMERIKGLEAVQKKSQAAGRNTTKEMRQKQDLIKGLNQQIQKGCLEISSIKTINSELSAKLSKVVQQYQSTLKAKDQLQKELIEKEVQLDSFFSELQTKQKEIESITSSYKSQKNKLQEEIQRLKSKLQNSNQELTAQIKELSFKVQALSEQNTQKVAQFEIFKQQTSALQIQLRKQISKKIEDIRQISDELHKQQTKYAELVISSESLAEHLREQLNILQNGQQILKEELQKKQQMHLITSRELQIITKRLKQKERENEQLTNTIKIMEESLHNQKTSEILNLQIETLKQSYSILVKKENYELQLLKQAEVVIATLREDNQKLQSELKNVTIELSVQKDATSIKEQTIQEHEVTIKKLGDELTELKTHISSNKEELDENQKTMKKQIEQLQRLLEYERKQSSEEIQRLKESSNGLVGFRLQLQEKVKELTKSLQSKELSNQLQADYLKPIKQNLMSLRGYMNECSAVGSQFQTNKNKLLKMATIKLQQYNDRNVADKIREISLAFQRLKASVLSNGQLSQEHKLAMSEEMKKVQFSLDRALRGER